MLRGGYSTAYPGILKVMKRSEDGVDTGYFMGLLLGGRTVGSVAGGPVSAALLKAGSLKCGGDWSYGTQYGSLIVVTGATALFGVGVGFGRYSEAC